MKITQKDIKLFFKLLFIGLLALEFLSLISLCMKYCGKLQPGFTIYPADVWNLGVVFLIVFLAGIVVMW